MSPIDVFIMVSSQRFQEQKCQDAEAISWHCQISVSGDETVIKTRRKLPTAGFPALLRKVVPSGVSSTETITWGPPAADGSRIATLHVEFHGAPARMHGTIDLRPKGPSTELVLEAEFKAGVPVIGGKIEKVAAPIIIGVIDAEQQTGREWPTRTR